MRGRRVVAVVLACVLGITVVEAMPAQARSGGGAQPSKPVAAPAPDDSSRPDLVSALQVARRVGRQVEVTGQRSETTTVWANPDGSFTRKIAAVPQRWRDGQGGWHDLDLTLATSADGALAPRSAAPGAAARLPATGDGVISLPSGVGVFGLAHPGAARRAAQPTGGLVRYPGALGGRDLEARVLVHGLEEQVVLPDAAASTSWTDVFTVPAGVSARSGGPGVEFLDRAGRVVASFGGGRAHDADPAAPGGEGVETDVATRLVGQAGRTVTVRVGVDPTWLADPSRVFPVTVDPLYYANTATAGSDTWVANNVTTSQWSSTELRVGYGVGGGSQVARSLLWFDLKNAPGGDDVVTEAHLTIYNYQSGSCTAHPVYLSGLAGGFNSSTVWSTAPGSDSYGVVSTTSFAYGASGCPSAWANLDLTSLAQRWFTQGASNFGFRLQGTEQSGSGWKRFKSGETDGSSAPALYVTYHHRPQVPTVSVSPCGTCTGSLWSNSDQPTLSGVFVDRDGGTGHVDYEIDNGATVVASGVGATVSSGVPSPWQVPVGTLSAGVAYTVKAKGDNNTETSAWSTAKTLTLDITAPAAPGVSSTQYPSGAWSGSPTTPGTFNLTDSNSDVASYLYGLDQTPPGTSVAASSGSASVTITPSSGPHQLYVQAVDKAGNRSATTGYQFNTKPGAVTLPAEGDSTSAQVSLKAVVEPAVTAVRFQWRRADTDPWADIPPADVQNGGVPLSAWPLAISGGASPELVWDVGATLGHLDGSVQVQAVLTGGSSGTTSTRRFTYDQNAVGRHATAPVGPGEVDLLTGNLSLSGSDVSLDAWGSDLTVSRTANSRTPAVTGVFGPGWTSNFPVDAASSDWARLDQQNQYASVLATDADGAITAFARKTAGTSGTTYTPEVGAEDLTLTSNATTVGATPTQLTLADLDGNATTFTVQAGVWRPSSVKQATGDTTSYTFDTAGRVTQVLAPKPATVAGSCVPLVAGCRALGVDYAPASTPPPTGSTLGDYPNQVRDVTFTAYDPATSAMATVEVAHYAYDASGRLRQVWDPRLPNDPATGAPPKTSYAYDAAGHVTGLTPPGELGWTIAYAAVAPDTNPGRLQSVSRPGLPSGTATATVVYHVPLTGAGAPYAMGPADVAGWAQQDVPSEATAVFPPDQVPASPPASYARATITYLDPNGQAVNTATPGGSVSTSEYDQFGNLIRTLSAANRACALADTCALPDGTLASDHAAKARMLDAHTVYSADGLDELESFGPLHLVKLPGGDTVAARAHTAITYDENPPTGGPYHLATTTTAGAWLPGQTSDSDVRVTTTGYDDPDKPPSSDPNSDYRVGWKLRQAITTTTDPGASPHLNLKSITRYDKTTGLAIESRMPANPTGGDAHSSKTIYYTGDTSSGDSACNAKPQWANLACKTLPAAQPATPGLPALPVTTTTYDRYNQPAVVTDTVGADTRTTTTSYDPAGRTTDVAVTATVGTALPSVHTDYDPATGRATTTSTTDASGTSTIIRGYDTLGRLTSYQDADSTTPATTTYDLLDRPVTSGDGKGTQTYSYDTSIDPRGLPTSVTDSAAGTFTARYDPDGDLTTQGYPNGMEARTAIDPTGNTTRLAYVKTSNCTSNCTWLEFNATDSIHAQQADSASTLGDQTDTYDAAGRLSSVQDTPTGDGCTIRAYTYDADTNRTSQTSKPPAADGTCDLAATGTTVTHAYDAADRLTDTGFAYDSFGRITTVPAAAAGTTGDVTAAYYTTDMVRALTQAATTHTWTLDPTQRLRARTDTGGATGSKTNHYADDTDSPSWVAEDATATHWTRNIAAFGSDLAAIQDSATGTTLQLANLHGDTVATASLDPAATGLLSTFDTSEFGVPRTSPSPRYGWLGQKQRETDDLTGLTLMGVRLYAPTLGRFLQVDPEPGGSANDYDYASQDPINVFDLDGRCGWRNKLRSIWQRFRVFGRSNPCAEENYRMARRYGIGGAVVAGYHSYVYRAISDPDVIWAYQSIVFSPWVGPAGLGVPGGRWAFRRAFCRGCGSSWRLARRLYRRWRTYHHRHRYYRHRYYRHRYYRHYSYNPTYHWGGRLL